MKFLYKYSLFTLLAFLFFSGCEKLETIPEIKQLVHEENDPYGNLENQEKAQPPPTSEKVIQKTPPKIALLPVIPAEKPPVAKPFMPEQPNFSEELLSAVKNWTKIPKSVFPAQPILANIDLNLVAKTSSGQIIGSSLTPAGAELKALGMKGSTLIVANLNNSKLQGEIDIDQTDFKQLLAYRFELNKRKREELLRRKEEQPQIPSESLTENKKSTKTTSTEDIPDPLDFGHGRFCICKDCREKRIAKTGSLKTGFGLEP